MFGAGLTDFIVTGGLLVIAATVYLECGFIIGFFLPGDTLLFLAGFLAGKGTLNIFTTIGLIAVAAILGNVTGYYIGKRAGPKLFTRDDSIFFQKRYILEAQKFYEKHGGKTLILARFIPFVRTFAPLVGGIGRMPFQRFFTYTAVGAVIWAALLPSIGFWAYRVLGRSINIEKYVLPVVLLITVVSIGGSAFHAIREGRKHRGKVRAAELQKNQTEVDQHID